MRTYKKKRRIKLDYNKQGFVYFICTQYRNLPQNVRAEIDNVASGVGGFDEAALRKLLFDVTATVQSVSREYNLSEWRLCVLRDEFYRKVYEKLTVK